MASKRSRNWLAVVYPESLPPNWESLLIENYQVEFVCSPLHEFDLNEDGSSKKPHYHLIIVFSSGKTYEQCKEITDFLNAPIPQPCISIKGAIRYLIHLDNPEKFQYNQDDIRVFGGLDISYAFALSDTTRYYIIRDICDYIKNADVQDFSELVDYALYNEFNTWLPVIVDKNSYFLNTYIKSKRRFI